MDYDVVRTNVINACRNYKQEDSVFYNAMNNFYREGKKNPSVARIILQDHIFERQKISKNMLNDAASFSQADIPAILYPEFADRIKQLYNLSALETLKSLALTDIYKETAYINDDLGNYERRDFDKKWAELYPKTGKIRERIIEADRISMDGVNKKADWLQKINYAKTIAEYKKDYPKSFFARYSLILDGQILENEVTPRVKCWFNRFVYKRFIKNGFCFKKGK